MQIFFRMVIDFACGAMGMKKDDLPRLANIPGQNPWP